MEYPNIVPCPACQPYWKRTLFSELSCTLCMGKRKIDLNTTHLAELSVPVCPYCGTRDEEWWDGGCYHDGEGVVVASCSRCDADYSVSYKTSINFTSERLELDEDKEDPKDDEEE